jgi:glutamate carboxypeptidase
MTESPALMPALYAELRRCEAQMTHLLGRFVRCESPSHNKGAVDSMGEIIAREWKKRGAKVQIIRQKKRGNHVRAELWFGAHRPARQILAIGHLDTVYPLGTLAKMPFKIRDGRAYGPGTFDMKAGLVFALAAVDVLRTCEIIPENRLAFFWNSDEEIGSETSRKLIEKEAHQSDAVLVLEPAYGSRGKLKTARKGVGTAEITVTGRAAHAGLNPGAGVNAVHELALQIARVMEMNDLDRGIGVQATVAAGGTVSNVVPDHAHAHVDIRIAKLADGLRVERRIHRLRPILKGAKVEVSGGINRPPLERTPAVLKLFDHAQALMQEIGVSIEESAVGGGSDGNFTAALGVPTLDGLGAIGDGAHSPREHVLIRSLPERAALLAGLLATL